MPMPGRNMNNGDYRYGFGGHEKDDELKGNSNSYDLGARMYDPRIGRTLSMDPEAHVYPMFSPYSGFGNNPLTITDPDGKLLRDSDGNLIVVKAGSTSKTKTIYTGAYADGASKQQPILIKYTYQDVYVFNNKGEKIKAQLVTKQQFLVKQGNQTFEVDPQSSKMLSKNLDASSNCHGVSCANGELTIFSEDIGETMLDETEFKTTSKEDATTVVYTDGKGTVTHSAKKKGDSYTYSDGATPTKQGDANAASRNGKYKNPKYKKEVQKKSNWAGGNTTSNPGLRIFNSKEDVQKSNPNDSKKLKL